jgi:uncharacterized membrane protein HdeD (DUF308 family)
VASITGGGIVGLVLAVAAVYAFVDADMVLTYYVAGLIAGGVIGGVAAARWSRRRVGPR